MEKDVMDLDEEVVVGYGVQKRSCHRSTVQIKNEEFTKNNSTVSKTHCKA
jgi:hypothetical protein